jgi:hypothetical protein
MFEYTISKETILNIVSEQQIFDFYLKEYGIKVEFNVQFRNPLRADNIAGCTFGFSTKSNKLILMDWAYESYSCFDIVMIKYKINYGQAIQKINRDINKILEETNVCFEVRKEREVSKKIITKVKEIKIKRKLYSKRELDFWAINGLTITPNLLQKNKIFSVESYKIGDSFFKCDTITFAYHWFENNCQLYMPYNDGKKRPKFLISPNLLIGDEEFLPQFGSHLVITKSKKDSFYLRLLGINSIFIVNEKIKIDEFTYAIYKAKFKNIFTLFDNDKTGLNLSIHYRKIYKDIIPLYFNKKTHKKDFTDNLKYFGLEEIQNLIDIVKTKYNII